MTHRRFVLQLEALIERLDEIQDLDTFLDEPAFDKAVGQIDRLIDSALESEAEEEEEDDSDAEEE